MESFAQLHGYFMYSAKPLFVPGSRLAISFVKIKIDVNFKNLFGINFFPQILMCWKNNNKMVLIFTYPRSQLLQNRSSLGMPFCLPFSGKNLSKSPCAKIYRNLITNSVTNHVPNRPRRHKCVKSFIARQGINS